jgi:hypothetical protein
MVRDGLLMFHMDHDKCSLASYQTMDVGLMIAIEANGDAPEPPSVMDGCYCLWRYVQFMLVGWFT